MKDKLKKLCLTLIICAVLSGYIAPSLTAHAADASTIVCITKTGSKYHLDGCRYLRSSKYYITLGEAISSGYTACSVCHAYSSCNWTRDVVYVQNNTQTTTTTSDTTVTANTTTTVDTTTTSNTTDTSTQTTEVKIRPEWVAVYDEAYYLEQNPDLVAAFGTDSDAIFQHFVTSGIYEGRSGCADFNALTYKENYPDLQGAFGDDLLLYVRHYIYFGKKEGRTGL